jgi:HlyD family secretion protein
MVRYLFIALFLALLLGILVISGNTSETSHNYRTATAEQGEIVRYVTASGRLQAVEEVEVSSQLSGQIAELFADHNSEVRIGQPLAKLDDAAFAAKVQEAEARLANAKAALLVAGATTAGTEARLEEANRDLKRKKSLGSQGAISVRDHDTALMKMLDAKSARDAARALEKVRQTEIDIANAVLRQAQIDMGRTVIRAPINGIVVGRNVDLGQTVAASLQAPTLFSIAQDLKNMEVETFVDEADIGVVRIQQRAVFRVDAYPNLTFEGRVLEIRKAYETTNNVITYTVIVSADNREDHLLPGMTAVVNLIVAERRDVLTIPNAALRFRPAEVDTPTADHQREGQVFVVQDDGTLRPVAVHTGQSDELATEVVSGNLYPGQHVAIGYRPRKDNGGDFLGLKWGL